MEINLNAEREIAATTYNQITQQIQQCEQQLGALHMQLEQQRGLLLWLDSKLSPQQQQDSSAQAEPTALTSV